MRRTVLPFVPVLKPEVIAGKVEQAFHPLQWHHTLPLEQCTLIANHQEKKGSVTRERPWRVLQQSLAIDKLTKSECCDFTSVWTD